MDGWQIAVLVAGTGASGLVLVFSVLIWRRQGGAVAPVGEPALLPKVMLLSEGQDRIERTVRDDLRNAREEGQTSGRQLREEVQAGLRGLAETLLAQTAEMARQQREGLDLFAGQIRSATADAAAQLVQHREALVGATREMREQTGQHLDAMRSDGAESAKSLREQVGQSLAGFGELTRAQTGQLFEIQRAQHEDFATRLAAIGDADRRAGAALREGIDAQLTTLRRENAEKLEQMRNTVDEKLQGTLEQRLGESFRLVSDRLDAVHKGLGEMQVLATGVGDLKRVLTNVKARGSWGEVQLGALLDQMLTQGQYITNVATSEGSDERVEYAIRLPDGLDGADVLLPIDAKFPTEDYERLQLAAEAGDTAAVEQAARGLEARIKGCAKDICTKYINPPRTTDFAILFLPTEGLYAEVIRRPGLCEEVQRCWRVTVVGPTTIVALLNSLQMGFRTLAIQKRSSEVWQVLGAVKTEFGKFGPALDKVKKKLQEASNHVDGVGVRERAIRRKLRQIEELPEAEASAAFASASALDEEDGATIQ